MIEFKMPSLGADMEDGTLIEWKKKPGDTVKRGDIIAEVETQKGLIEIEIFDEGIIDKFLIQEGTKVPVGAVMALLQPSGVSLETKKEKEPAPLQPTEEKTIKSTPISTAETRKIKVSPLARRIAEENHINLESVAGTGPDGAITKENVDHEIAKIEKIEPEKINAPAVAIRSAIAAAMSKSNSEIPHYYLEKKIDFTKALAWLQEANSQRSIKKRLLPVVLLIKATARSLSDFPDLNAIWENGLQQKKDINIGFVVSLTTGGIIVPAIHHTNLKSVDEIMETLNDIIPRARAFKLRSSELTDSTITLTSVGENGADVVYGIIYPPQVAIVGFGTISEQPFAEKGMLGIRSVVKATLAGDHRATDGLIGSRFLAAINNYLQNPDSL
ncbi:dihydrolipoamide acetyltransferase family protein [Flavobacterium frigoris]|uniref:Dihydrolipoamide acetyltransferase component of pyruvate dehydrogenase complex n=1 Tax=Flavobacterium frigoris TaxID=229204 RepID=A0A1H9JX79_FLAFI|nr:dihydrolipoamide acetyltransferase family protein [Flavobacterium frigoris]SEQ91536.1 pyruvate dehydrogenase E2 component (dihydrolipoamide acetyltransferase) [Flavobacterium frigoris]